MLSTSNGDINTSIQQEFNNNNALHWILEKDNLFLSPNGKILKFIINYSCIVITTFTQSLIPFTIYKSSSNNSNAFEHTSLSSKSIILSYQCSSAIVMSEIFKLFIAICVVFYEFEYNIPKTMETMLFDVFQVHTFAISGILYSISNIITIQMISEIGFIYIYYSLIFCTKL